MSIYDCNYIAIIKGADSNLIEASAYKVEKYKYLSSSLFRLYDE